MQSESIVVHATYKDIRMPTQRLRALLLTNHVREEVINLCELALHELLTNLVDHAYQGDENRLIKVNMIYDAARILIETQDTGIPSHVDLDNISMPDPADLAEGGYGVAIIQSLMDEVEYKHENGKNLWKLVKQISN